MDAQFNTSSAPARMATRTGDPLPPDAVHLIGVINSAPGLSPARRPILSSAIRSYVGMRQQIISDGGNCPDAPGPAILTCATMNFVLWQRSPRFHGMEVTSFRNLVSNLRVVLRLAGRHAPNIRGQAKLAPEWHALFVNLPNGGRRHALIGCMAFCSLKGVAPPDVTDETLIIFRAWLAEENLEKRPQSSARAAVTNLNWASANLPGWPPLCLTYQGTRRFYTPRLEACLESFQADAQLFLGRLGTHRVRKIYPKNADHLPQNKSPRSRPRPLKVLTIKTRELQIRQAVAALEASGIPREALSSLRDLVQPVDRVETILGFHSERARAHRPGYFAEDEPVQTTALVGITEVLRQIGKFHCNLPDEEMAFISELAAAVSPPPQQTINDRIVERLRVLFEPHNYAQLINYSAELMRHAKDLDLQPKAAARLVILAVAIEFLMFIALRRENLAQLHLDTNLKRPVRGGLIERIYVPTSSVKGDGKFIDLPIPMPLARLLETYVRKYRPHLAEPDNRWLFPGLGMNHRSPGQFGTTITRQIEQDIGVRFNPHLARHFAAVRFLRDHPGQYAIVSRLLGHTNIEMTRRYYASFLDADSAANAMNAALIKDRQATKHLAALAFRPKRTRRQAKGSLG